MFERIIELVLPEIIGAIELVGIIVVTIGAANGFYHYLRQLFKQEKYALKFELANSMATGLEFKMAAEILKTVLVRDINELLILGCVILLRALLSFIIHVEMKGSREEGQEEE